MPFLAGMFGPCACEPADHWLRDYRLAMERNARKPVTVAEVNWAWAYRPRCWRWRCREDGPLTEEQVRAHLPVRAPEPVAEAA